MKFIKLNRVDEIGNELGSIYVNTDKIVTIDPVTTNYYQITLDVNFNGHMLVTAESIKSLVEVRRERLPRG